MTTSASIPASGNSSGGEAFWQFGQSAMHRELESPFEWSRKKTLCAVLVHPAKPLFVHAVWVVGVSRMSFFPLQVAEATGTDITQPLSPGIDAKELAHKMSQLSAGVGLHMLLGCRGRYTSKQNCMVGKGVQHVHLAKPGTDASCIWLISRVGPSMAHVPLRIIWKCGNDDDVTLVVQVWSEL